MDTRPRRIEGLKGSWEWLSFAASLPAKAVNFGPISADTQLFTGPCIYKGFAMANNAAGGSNFNLFDGRDANGPPLNFDFPGNGSTITRLLTAGGVLCESGVFLHISTGPIVGSLFIVPLWHEQFTPPGE